MIMAIHRQVGSFQEIHKCVSEGFVFLILTSTGIHCLLYARRFIISWQVIYNGIISCFSIIA